MRDACRDPIWCSGRWVVRNNAHIGNDRRIRITLRKAMKLPCTRFATSSRAMKTWTESSNAVVRVFRKASMRAVAETMGNRFGNRSFRHVFKRNLSKF